MASIRIPDLPPAGPAAEPWPADDVTIRADELFARRLDTEFSAGVRELLHNPETGLSALSGEAALEAIASIYPALEELKQRTLDGAVGLRQRALLEPSINTRLDWAAGTLGRLAERATIQVDDESVAQRLAGLGQDAAASWDDAAHLRKLGRAAVGELRWQGERRGWDATETDARAKAGLSDLYAGAVEAAMERDLDGATSLLAHAREVIDPARLETIDLRLARAREDGFLREVDAALKALPLDPAAPPLLDAFTAHAAELTPGDATDGMRARLDDMAAHAQRRAERQWNRRQAEAGIAALDWLKQNPDLSSLFLPEKVRAWLASDQFDGLKTLEQRGRLATDPDLFWRLDRLSVYDPEAFATLDLDRHRLSLNDADHTRFAAAQKAIVDGATDPAFARYRLARAGIDRALEAIEKPVGNLPVETANEFDDPNDLFPAWRLPDRPSSEDLFHQIQDVRDNYRQGKEAERVEEKKIRRMYPGATIATQVPVFVDGGPKYMVADIIFTQSGNAAIQILEVKSGGGDLTPNQMRALAEAAKTGNIYIVNPEKAKALGVEPGKTFGAQGILPQVTVVGGDQEKIRRQMIKAGLEVVPAGSGRGGLPHRFRMRPN